MSKKKLIIYRRIATLGYVVTDETDNHISKCSNLAQNLCKTRYNCVGKVGIAQEMKI